MKKIFVSLSSYLLILLLSFYLLIPISVRAIEEAQAENVNVGATVDSKVSEANSQVTLNVTETLADPVNHPILLTVILKDKDQKPLPDREVLITSNRGEVDVIEATSKLSHYQVHAAEISDMQKGKTDEEGQVSFRITSFIPGKAILQVLADNVVKLNTQTIQFKTLPFPAELTITLELPWTQKEWTMFSPQLQEENLSLSQIEAKAIANPGTKTKINFWVFLLFLLIVVGMPIFIILSFINLRRIRWMEKEQTLLLKKMFPPNYNRQG